MPQLTKSKTIRFNEQQMKGLDTLSSYGVNVNQFIRQAIKEKLQRDWKSIKEKRTRSDCPF